MIKSKGIGNIERVMIPDQPSGVMTRFTFWGLPSLFAEGYALVFHRGHFLKVGIELCPAGPENGGFKPIESPNKTFAKLINQLFRKR